MSTKCNATKLSLRFYGPFSACWSDETAVRIVGNKKRALLALLATSPDGKRTREFLGDMLWRSGPEHQRLSLRGALSDLRKLFGDRFDLLFETTNDEVRLIPGTWEVIGEQSDGMFLEGLSVATPLFENWLASYRSEKAKLVLGAPKTEHLAPEVLPPVSAETREEPTELHPTVAVLRFANTPGNEFETLIGDMLAEEVTRALSRSALLNVISHLSCRAIDPDNATTSDLEQRLGLDYVLSGRVRISGDHYQLSVEFIDIRRQAVCWSRDIVGPVTGFIEGSDDVAHTLARAAGKQILSTSIEVAAALPLHEVESHHLLISAIALMHRQALSSFSLSRPQLEEVIARAPRCAILHAWLGKWYVLSVGQGWSVDFAKDTAAAVDCTNRALDLDPECAFALAVDGFVQNNLVKRFDIAAMRFDEALELDPNNALAWLIKGNMHAFVDEGDEAVACTERAQRLSPLDPHKYFFDSLGATARLSLRDFEGALDLANRSLKANRRHASTLRVRTIALQSLNRDEEASASASELIRLQPALTVEGYLHDHPAAAFATGREWAEALRKSGIPLN